MSNTQSFIKKIVKYKKKKNITNTPLISKSIHAYICIDMHLLIYLTELMNGNLVWKIALSLKKNDQKIK